MPNFPEKTGSKAPTRRSGELGPSNLLKRDESLAARYKSDLDRIYREVNQVPPEVVFLLDVSGSMRDTIGQVQSGCLESSKQRISSGSCVSIICFESESKTHLRRSRDLEEIAQILGSLQAWGGTRMSQSFSTARQFLEKSKRPLIILISDGVPGDPLEAISEARACVRAGITVRCIGTSNADQAFLDKLAGGEPTVHSEIVSPANLAKAIVASAMAALPQRS